MIMIMIMIIMRVVGAVQVVTTIMTMLIKGSRQLETINFANRATSASSSQDCKELIAFYDSFFHALPRVSLLSNSGVKISAIKGGDGHSIALAGREEEEDDDEDEDKGKDEYEDGCVSVEARSQERKDGKDKGVRG